jgi:Ricin-type beta-trefoil lectin domain-like
VPRLRTPLAALATTAALALATSVLAASPASATPAAATYTVTVGSTGSFANPDDTPAGAFIDKDGTFYYQESYSDYGVTDPHQWSFYTGTNFDTATADTALDNAVNPADSSDSNADTTVRCENGPTGVDATADSAGGYPLSDYCDLVGTWVDPDTGNWYGLVHNEFTGSPFGDALHYDSIDYAESTDQGQVWTILGHAITSPYSTTRGDTTAFPNSVYDYGDGDPRLYVDTASGYFYVYYGSRIVPKGGVAGSTDGLAHVARAPISGKMASGTWQKWYDGSWSQPGIGGLESNLEPTSVDATGYTPVADDYNPANTGDVDQQIAAGVLPSKSPLFLMNITYDAYLGLYIGEPEQVSTTGPQQYYATSDLATQQWTLIGDSGSYTDQSWYRWFVDSANATSSTIVGKTFRSYCSVSCYGGSGGLYENTTIASSAPAAPVDTTKVYTIGSGSGRFLSQVSGSSATTSLGSAGGSALAQWQFTSDGDGSYTVADVSTGQLLGVDSTSTASRAWGTAPTVTPRGPGGPTVGQQWFVIPSAPADGTFRLVNRYSGLVIGMSATAGRLAETTPPRNWTDTSGSPVGDGRTAAEQTLRFAAVGAATDEVSLDSPGTQAGTVGTAVSLQIAGTDQLGKALTYSATGLPAGLSISVSGLISGTPTTTGTSNVTVTATSGTASGSTTFGWAVDPELNGTTHTLTAGGMALDDPGSSTSAGVQLDTWTPAGSSNQQWTFEQQSDGSYEIVNVLSGLCVDVDGGGTGAGEAIDQYTCVGSTNQLWDVAILAGGAYSITNERSGLVLTTASTSAGALVTQQANTGSALQQWTID